MHDARKRILLQCAFFISSVACVGTFGFSCYAFAVGVAELLRVWTPDNLAFGLGFMCLLFGTLPSLFVALKTRSKLKGVKTVERGARYF
jgi:hypothetical protein